MPKYLTNFDLSQNQLLNAAVHNHAGNPNTDLIPGVKGQLIFSTTENKLYVFSGGTTWTLASGSDTTYAISAETSTGGANLRLTGSDTVVDDVKFANGANVTITQTDANTITIAATDTNTTYSAGDGLGLTGTVFSLDTPSTVAVASTNAVTADSHTHAITTTTVAAVSTVVATDASGNITGNRLISSVAQGTAPLGVTSNTVVPNLNASLLEGNAASAFQPAGTYLTPTSTNTLTNKSLSDSTTWFVDVTDATKRLNIDVTGTTGITGVLQTTFTTAKTIIFPDLAGTVALTTNKLSVFAATTSDELRGVISDETGTGGGLVFATAPVLSGPTIDNIVASGAAVAADIFSEITTGSIAIGAGLTTGDVVIGGSQTAGGEITLGSASSVVVIPGGLTVNGTLTTINSNEVNIGDNHITLNADITTSAANTGGGIGIKRLMADNLTRKDADLLYNNTTNRWEMVYGAVTDTLETTSIPVKKAFTLSTSATSYVLTHNLGTQDVQVTIYEVGSPYAVVYADVEHTSTSTVTVRFAVAPAINMYRVVIIG